MNHHPRDAALLAHCESEGRTDADPAVRAHLDAGCERCRMRIHTYEEVLVSLESPALQVAPENLVRCALERIVHIQGEKASSGQGVRRAAHRLINAATHGLREVQMALVLDSQLGTVLPGIRTETALQPRQILFESAEGSIHLQIQRKRNRKFELIGQYIPFQGSIETGARIILEREGRQAGRKLAATGEFRFPSVDPGQFRLALECNDVRLTAGPVEIREGTGA